MNKTRSFQTNHIQHKKFQERSLGDDKNKNSRKKTSSSSEYNSNKTRTKDKRNYQSETKPLLTNSSLRSSNGEERKVKVQVKGQQLANKEKKTGPLSPRAPEKIRKNRAEEMKVYGENACYSLFNQRPESIVRVWTTVAMAHKVGHIFSYLATHKKVYHVVEESELNLVSGTEHHGGICMLVKKTRPFSLLGYLSITRQHDCLLVLDAIHNAHNIGGIVRTCAFYGVKGIVIEDNELLNSSSAMRVAEGGMEHVYALENVDTDNSLEQLRQAGYQIVHCSLDKQAIPIKKLKLEDKVAFVLSETSSLSLASKTDCCVNLSYTNPLAHGLNVAVSAGVLLSYWQMR